MSDLNFNKKAPGLLKDMAEKMSPKPRRKKIWLHLLFFIVLAFVLMHVFVRFTQIKLEGKATAVTQSEVQTLVEGVLEEIHVINAQKVKKGDLLFQFQNKDLVFEL